MSKVGNELASALLNKKAMKKGSSRIVLDENGGAEYLFYDTAIAHVDKQGSLIICVSYFSVTTLARLNCFEGVRVNYRKGQLFLNSVKWSGGWLCVQDSTGRLVGTGNAQEELELLESLVDEGNEERNV